MQYRVVVVLLVKEGRSGRGLWSLGSRSSSSVRSSVWSLDREREWDA